MTQVSVLLSRNDGYAMQGSFCFLFLLASCL